MSNVPSYADLFVQRSGIPALMPLLARNNKEASLLGAHILSHIATCSVAARCSMSSLAVVDQLVHLLQSDKPATATHAVIALGALAALPCHRCAGWHRTAEFKSRVKVAVSGSGRSASTPNFPPATIVRQSLILRFAVSYLCCAPIAVVFVQFCDPITVAWTF